MESIAVLSHGAGLVSIVAVAVAMLLAGLMFLVFRMSPGPDYKEVFRKQREQLMVSKALKFVQVSHLSFQFLSNLIENETYFGVRTRCWV